MLGHEPMDTGRDGDSNGHPKQFPNRLTRKFLFHENYGLENAPVLSFYEKDTHLSTFTVKDLGLKAEDLERSMSRFSASKSDSPPRYIGHYTLDNLASRNPLILSRTMRIRGANVTLFYFNITSGELLKEVPKEIKEVDYNRDQTESVDPFGFQKSKVQEVSDSSQKETDKE